MTEPLTQQAIHELMEEIKDDRSPRNRARQVLLAWIGEYVDACRTSDDIFKRRSMELTVVQAIVDEYRRAEAALGDSVCPETGCVSPAHPLHDQAQRRDGLTRFTGEGER